MCRQKNRESIGASGKRDRLTDKKVEEEKRLRRDTREIDREGDRGRFTERI